MRKKIKQTFSIDTVATCLKPEKYYGGEEGH